MAKLDAARERVAKATGRTPKVTLCYEAGYDGFWLARFLEQCGIDCRVMEPASLQVNRRARRVNLSMSRGYFIRRSPGAAVNVTSAPCFLEMPSHQLKSER